MFKHKQNKGICLTKKNRATLVRPFQDLESEPTADE
jgi:hypothetical protein